MKKLIIAASMALTATSAAAQYQMTHYLVAQWYENGNQMCRYDNGTVLNMGYRICPLSIKG
jgi:hypothetical protein